MSRKKTAELAETGAVRETPLMKQYNEIKAKHPGALLLFRVGDFYETFGEDAIKASKILDIVLTKRSNGAASQMELAGFPHHALDTYLPKLVRAGNRVAICDQLEDPKSVKGIVKRGVTELVTPGLSFNDHVLEQKFNNYLASVFIGKEAYGIAFLDVSTGEFMTARGPQLYIENLLQSLQPREIIYSRGQKKEILKIQAEKNNVYALEDWIYTYDFGYDKLINHFQSTSLKGFGVERLWEGIIAAGAILHYLNETEHHELGHITSISRIEEEKYVWLDKFTIRNLELVYAQQENGTPLIRVLDRTLTPMGSRLLKRWLLLPLKDPEKIQERLDAVELLVESEHLREQVAAHLEPIGDLERLISKVAVNRINPREMVQLKKSLSSAGPIQTLLIEQTGEKLANLANHLNPCADLLEKIEAVLQDNPPLQIHQGNLIRDGVDDELDELRQIAYSGKDYLIKIQQREIEKTGITSLKIAYNKVFGYYLEVTNAHKDKVPDSWIRKQTLVNAERYITEELKTYEEKILHAEERLTVIEQRLFQELINEASGSIEAIQQNAKTLATLDCLHSFAEAAIDNRYSKPNLNEGGEIDIREGRHPVIEKTLPLGESYIPNSVFLDQESQQIMIITGPNMAGKSALLRQTALIVLMAQVGSYVPAAVARIGYVDKIFTRVGASDNLSQGESTFMVEMMETASIMNNLSDRSLVLMDEIGRGTSTYDGISIAWAICEFLHEHPQTRAKTLFATHYHELNQLADQFPRIKNFNVAVKEVGNKVLFMRKLKEGGSEHSFGIHVAQMAGMPNQIVIRSSEIMHHLEKDQLRNQRRKKLKEMPKSYQLSLFEADPRFEEVLNLLGKVDINTISPVEALLKLNEIKMTLKGE